MFDPEIHHRRSIRLQGFDYSSAGGYFITTNTRHRAHLFGKIVNGEMILSQAGEIVRQRWLAMPSVFPVVELDEFVVKSEPAPPTVGEVVRAFKAVSARTINRISAKIRK